MKDYYRILGIPQTADKESIKKAYHTLIKKFHPDLNKSSDSVKSLTLINEAYKVLSDPEKKKAYDELLKKNYIKNESQKTTQNERLTLILTFAKILFYVLFVLFGSSFFYGNLKSLKISAKPILLSLSTCFFLLDISFWADRILKKPFFKLYKVLRWLTFSISALLIVTDLLAIAKKSDNLKETSLTFSVILFSVAVIGSMEDYTNFSSPFWTKNFLFHAKKIASKVAFLLFIFFFSLFFVSRIEARLKFDEFVKNFHHLVLFSTFSVSAFYLAKD